MLAASWVGDWKLEVKGKGGGYLGARLKRFVLNWEMGKR